MVVLLMLAAFLIFAPAIGRPLFIAGAAGAALIAAVLLVTGARTVWLGVAAGGFWLLWHWNRRIAIFGPAAVVLLLWVMPGPVHDRFLSLFHPRRNLDSNEFRLICIRTGTRMIESHPWLGIGLDETKYHFLDYLPPDTRRPLPPGFYQHLHNVYLQYAAERGIPTMLMMLWLFAQVLYDFLRALKKSVPARSNERFLLHGAIAAVIGIMASGLFEVNLGDSEVLTAFLVVVACGYLAAQKLEAAHELRPDAGTPTLIRSGI
jgi:O-antigen ligase